VSARLFLARLAGAIAFDPNGDQVGKVRDVVTSLSVDHAPPRVLGLVLEVPPKRRIFLPIGRVRSFAAGQIVVKGMVNLRKFEKRSSETLVFAELLDHRVGVAGEPYEGKIIDVGIEQDARRDWHVTGLYLRKGGGLRRKAETRVVPWQEITGLHLADPEQGADEIVAQLDRTKAVDIAEMLQELPTRRRIQIATALNDRKLSRVLEELPEETQVEILNSLDVERAADVLEEMAPDDATDLISELSPGQAAVLLQRMEPDEAQDIRRLLSYAEDTAGGLMTTEPIILNVDCDVVDALAIIRQPELTPAIASQVYVVRPPTETPTGRYVGTVHMQSLLRAPPTTSLPSLVDTELEPIGPDTPLPEITRHFAAYNLVAAPVVDAGDHLVGAVTVDDVLDHMLPEDWRVRRVGRGSELA